MGQDFPREIRDGIYYLAILSLIKDTNFTPDGKTIVFDPARLSPKRFPWFQIAINRQIQVEIQDILHSHFYFWDRKFTDGGYGSEFSRAQSQRIRNLMVTFRTPGRGYPVFESHEFLRRPNLKSHPCLQVVWIVFNVPLDCDKLESREIAADFLLKCLDLLKDIKEVVLDVKTNWEQDPNMKVVVEMIEGKLPAKVEIRKCTQSEASIRWLKQVERMRAKGVII